jgi:hypothetical protein
MQGIVAVVNVLIDTGVISQSELTECFELAARRNLAGLWLSGVANCSARVHSANRALSAQPI